MAGHSKWANIKHRKGAQDASRAKEFQKLAKEIYVAAKSGDPNPDMNPLLRLSINKAKAANMPNDKINNAINKAKGIGTAEDYEAIRYEGYGPAGVAIMVDCLTDNRNRTAAAVRSTFTKYGGNLGTDGSVSYMFKRVGLIIIETELSEDELLEIALDAGASDVKYYPDRAEIITEDKDLVDVQLNLENHNIKDFLVAEVTYLPDNYVTLNEEDTLKFEKLIMMLEDLDDVNNVYHNLAD